MTHLHDANRSTSDHTNPTPRPDRRGVLVSVTLCDNGGMTDDELVAQELARLDALADVPDEVTIDDALYAYVRAWAIRRAPVNVVAAVLRQEALQALGERRPWVSTKWPVAVFHLKHGARWAGVPWSYLPRDDEMRMYVRTHPRAPGKVFPRRRPCHGTLT